MEDNSNNNTPDLRDTDLFKFLNKFKFTIATILLVFGIGYLSYYTVDANEKAVILRLGKYHDTVGSGLHFRVPLIDHVEKVKVDLVYKMEFGYETIDADIKTQYSTFNFEDVSWMLTRDLDIAEVKWVVQYKIVNPSDYLFRVKNVEKTIMDVSEAAMRLEVGDHIFDEVLGSGRERIALKVKEYMQQKLNEYRTGVKIIELQLMNVLPPRPVQDSFEEVNRAQQDKRIYENDAERKRTKVINIANGDTSAADKSGNPSTSSYDTIADFAIGMDGDKLHYLGGSTSIVQSAAATATIGSAAISANGIATFNTNDDTLAEKIFAV